MKSKAKRRKPLPYEPPRIEEEQTFERTALATCTKATVGDCGPTANPS